MGGNEVSFIFSGTRLDTKGDGGVINVAVTGDFKIQNGAVITTDTFGSGNAGKISINSAGKVEVLRGGIVSSGTAAQGNGGNITVTKAGGGLTVEGGGSAITTAAKEGSSGSGGIVRVDTDGGLTVREGGLITSATAGNGNAGEVIVKTAGQLVLEGAGSAIGSSAAGGSRGNVGNVQIDAAGGVTIRNGAVITGSTVASSNAGAVKLTTLGNLVIDGQGANQFTGIASEADAQSLGDAGDIQIEVGRDITLLNRGAISSDTYAQGRGGNVNVKANNIRLDRGSISAKATENSTGLTGNVEVVARDTLALGHASTISVENQAINSSQLGNNANSLKVSAPYIALSNGSQITSRSTGNLSASAITVGFSKQLNLNNASISTSAHDGNGGAISIQGSGLIGLRNAQITTSVTGNTNGNGGNIAITGDTLLLQSATITADTAAAAHGGDINLNLKGIVADGDNLIVGGNQLITGKLNTPGWNLIRAAAPDGVSGLIQFATPQLNLSGALTGLGGPQFQATDLDRSYCTLNSGSSLIHANHDGQLFIKDDDLLDD